MVLSGWKVAPEFGVTLVVLKSGRKGDAEGHRVVVKEGDMFAPFFDLLILSQSNSPALKEEPPLPVSSSSKENGVHVEQDDQDLFAGECVCVLGLSQPQAWSDSPEIPITKADHKSLSQTHV